MSFTIINELDYKTTGPRIVEKNKVAVFKNTQGNIIGENTENIKINNGIEISNENNTGSIILEPSSYSISQTLTFPATKGTSGQILENDGSGQLSWVNNGGGGGSGDVKGPVGSTDTAIAIYDGTTGKKIKNTGVTIDGTDSISTTGDLDANNVNASSLNTKNTGTGEVKFVTAPSSVITQTLTFPATASIAGQLLENDGTGKLSWVTPTGTGDVEGPAVSTGNAIAIYDGTTGKKIKNTGVTIDSSDNISTTGTVSGATNSTFGTLTLADGSITDSGGTISFGDENISTTGTVSGATNSTFGTLTLADGSITDSGGTISFGDENISTTGTITTTGINLDPVDATNTGEIKFKELSVNGTNYISLKASDSIDNDVSLTLPSADTTIPRYVLGSDASGNLDWYNRADLWATNTSYSRNDVVIAEYESEYRFFIALNSFTSTGSPFPGSQTIYIPPSGTGTNWQEISPFRGAIEGQISFAASLTPSALTGDVDNYNPSGLGSTNFLRLQTDGGNYTISGIAAPVPVVNQGIFIVNIGSTGNIQLLNNNSSSDTGNRFLIGGNKTIQDDEGIMLIYDDVSNRWRSQAIQI